MSDTLTQARELLEDQQFQQAIELLDQIKPATSTVKVSKARALSGIGRWEEAHDLFCDVLEEDPHCHEGYAGRGLLYFFTGDFDKAMLDYNTSIKEAPLNGRYRGLRGVLLAQRGDTPGAIKELEAAYDLGSTDPAYILARAQLHLTLKNLEQAKAALDLAEQHDADSAALSALEGGYNLLTGDHKEALASYRFAVEMAPEAVANWMNMLALTARIDRQRLLPETERALEAHPESDDLIQLAVGVFTENGRVKEAFQLLREALKRSPENPLLRFQMGMGLAQNQKYEKAIEHFSKALEVQPRFPRAYDARGNCLERLGRNEEAQQDFEKSRDIRQEDADKAAAYQQAVAAKTGARPPQTES